MQVKLITKQSWFHGFVSAEESAKFLLDRPKGTFLVRFARTRADSFALDYVIESGKPNKTVLIRCNMPTGVSIDEDSGKSKSFRNLLELVKHYSSTILLKPFTSDYHLQP